VLYSCLSAIAVIGGTNLAAPGGFDAATIATPRKPARRFRRSRS